VARAIGTLYNPVLYPNMSPLLSLSQTELGELIGLSRQSIGAALKQLQGEGLLSMGYGGIVIRDLHALAAYEERELARGGEGACVRALPPPAGLSPASRS
jgi:DNA-binding GntR family transcriptional regulator